MKVLLAGCGEVASRLGLALAAEGHRIVALRRRADRLPPELGPISVDMTDRDALERLSLDADAVVFTASADERTEAAYRRAYVASLGNVLDALVRLPGRLVFTSSTAVYGQNDGEWVDETSPTEPSSETGRILREAEELALSRGGTVVRLSGIYGRSRMRLVDSVAEGTARRPANPPVWTNRIHAADAAAALRAVIEHPDPPAVVLASDDEPADRGELLEWVARELGVPAPPVGEAASGRNKRCRNALLRSLGVALRFPTYREGYRAAIADRREGRAASH